MSQRTVFVTGGDGFIGRRILRNFLEDDLTLVLLSLPKYLDETRQLIDRWEQDPRTNASLKVVSGDITERNLGMTKDQVASLKGSVTDVIHLAAVYDLSIDRETARAINVEGTRNVVDFLRGCRDLDTFGYMSTTAISGDYEQVYCESDFDVGQTFNNHYEETKFEAEGIVREAREELPVIIYRPTTVVGDSETGEIDKIDGPYYLIRTIDRNMHLILPDTGGSKFHVEPVDFVADAFYTIFETPEATGGCYHLADPDPPTYREFVEMVCDYWDKPAPLLEVPPWLMEPVFSIPGAGSLFGLPAEAFTYSYLNRQYDTEYAETVLEGTGVSCPPVQDYLAPVLDYYRNNLAGSGDKKGRW